MAGATVHIEILVRDECPLADAALALAEAIARRLGPGITVEMVHLDSPECAQESASSGSVTLRVNGVDIDRFAVPTAIPPAWLVEAAVLRALSLNGVLFLCVANSARSQLAEGIARALAPADVTVWSAGSSPTRVRPEAIAALAEVGIDISSHRSKHVSEIPARRVDLVITLCAEEECPLFLGPARRVHWGLPDPAGVAGTDADRAAAFRQTRDELRHRLAVLFRAPDSSTTVHKLRAT
jgi:arsenate reductase